MDRFVARQPIFDAQRAVYAYELLFRTGWENAFPSGFSSEQASLSTLDGVLHTFSLEQICGTKPAFINATRQVLVEGLFFLLPPERAVCEVLETVEPDVEVVQACQALVSKGYTIALDDFVLRPGWEPLLELADIIKVDFRALDSEARKRQAEALGRYGVSLLAEKVETEAEAADAIAEGYLYLQGYFFARPEVRVAREVPAVQQLRLELLREVSQSSMNLSAIEAILRRDVALSVHLLRFLNSAAFGWRSKVISLKQALVLLGEVAFRRWVQVAAVGGLASSRDLEVLQTCLCRARFGELLAPVLGIADRALDLFWCGLLSGLERLTGQPLASTLPTLGVPEDLQRALLTPAAAGTLGSAMELIFDYELGDWVAVAARQPRLAIAPEQLPDLFAQSAEWARSAMSAASGHSAST